MNWAIWVQKMSPCKVPFLSKSTYTTTSIAGQRRAPLKIATIILKVDWRMLEGSLHQSNEHFYMDIFYWVAYTVGFKTMSLFDIRWEKSNQGLTWTGELIRKTIHYSFQYLANVGWTIGWELSGAHKNKTNYYSTQSCSENLCKL